MRAWHWINALAILFLLGSGLNIFNAHPRLYWGQYGADADTPFLSLNSVDEADGSPAVSLRLVPGISTPQAFWAGRSITANIAHVAGQLDDHPQLPGLGRCPPLAFLVRLDPSHNLLVYLGWSLWQRHLQHNIVPTRADLKAIPRSILDHIRFKHPTGEAAKRYNVLQRLAYLGVLFLFCLMVVTGLTMSPAINAFFPWLLDILGGRQSARSLHFISATLIVLFIFVHVTEVFIAGVFNEVRSMITGYFTVPREHD